MKTTCTRCGMAIIKSSLSDPYLCRPCDRTMTEDERYAFLDMR